MFDKYNEKEVEPGIGLKSMYDNQQCSTSAGGCANPSLRERISAQKFRAQQESRNANRLAELECLLDKNPEVARILDLLESVKGY